MATISLPTKPTARFAPYTTGEPIQLPSKGGHRALQPHRLCGRARGRRSARRHRSLARCRDRLGRAPSPSGITSGTSASASPKRWTPRSAAAGSTGRAPSELIKPRARGGEVAAGRADRLRRRHRSSRSRRPTSPSTTSSAPMKSRSKRSRRWAAGSSSWRAARWRARPSRRTTTRASTAASCAR